MVAVIATPGLTYRNPFWSVGFADPFLLKARGRYYAYATESVDRPPDGASVFPILTSPDLVQWSEAGTALPALGAPYFRYWAPEVTEHNGRFLLYYAVHTDEFAAAIRVAVAERPEGPFEDSGRDLTSHLFPWAIDPHVFRDDDGRWYLYLTIEYWDDPAGLVGSGNAVARMRDPFTLEGPPARVTPPRHAWQLFEARRPEKGGVDWYTVEGPAVMRHRRRYYEMFSGGCYYRDNYAVSYATSDTPLGLGGMHDASWSDWPGRRDGDGLLMRGDPAHAIGPGHNSLVLGPNNADLYIAYHAWPGEMSARRPCLDRLFWHGDELWTAAPTYGPRPAPALPRLRDLFERDLLAPSWRPEGGDWRVRDGAVVQENASAMGAALRHEERLGLAWLLEVNLRHIEGDGRYGVLLCNAAGVGVTVAVEPATRRVAVRSGDRSAELLYTVALPGDFVVGVWHQLVLAGAGRTLTLRLDGLPALEADVDSLVGSFALLAEGCGAAFTGVTLTDHVRDEFLDDGRPPEDLGWHAPLDAYRLDGVTSPDGGAPPAWRVRDGALLQESAARGEHVLMKGPPHEDYEYGATMRLAVSGVAGMSSFGLAARDDADGSLVVWLARHGERWALVAERRGKDLLSHQVEGSFGLPADFDPHAWHTLRLVRLGGGLTVYLDGPEALTVAAPTGHVRLGVATRDASAAFTSVWQTGLPHA